MRSNSPFDQARGFFLSGATPMMRLLIVTNVAALFLSVFGAGAVVIRVLAFSSDRLLSSPWSIITYAFVALDPLSVLLGGLWLWNIGGSLERAWGTRAFTLFFLLVSAASALSLWIGAGMAGAPAGAAGLWLPLAGVTVAFCLLNWNTPMCFWGVPCRAQHIMLLVLGLTFLSYAQVNPLLGFWALGGSAFAYAYMNWLRFELHQPSRSVGWRGRQIELESRQVAAPKRDWNPFVKLARWKRKRDFARLMKQSGFDDEIKPKG